MNKILFWILIAVCILVVLILAIAGITYYQASSVMNVAQTESENIRLNSQLFTQDKNCSHLNDIEDSIDKIESSFSGACKNPILNYAASKINELPIKCDTLPQFKEDVEKQFSLIKSYCDSYGNFNFSAINNSMTNEELMALAQKYGIQV